MAVFPFSVAVTTAMTTAALIAAGGVRLASSQLDYDGGEEVVDPCKNNPCQNGICLSNG